LLPHEDGSIRGYTYPRRPLSLVWFQDFPTGDEAFRAERQIKGWRRAKEEALIRGDWRLLTELAARKGPRQTLYPAHPSRASG
jgi:predicted GIY-YIG superfamily endonuclease